MQGEIHEKLRSMMLQGTGPWNLRTVERRQFDGMPVPPERFAYHSECGDEFDHQMHQHSQPEQANDRTCDRTTPRDRERWRRAMNMIVALIFDESAFFDVDEE
jgi:hypothetical protein